MCGNGARCTARFAGTKIKSIQTKAGIIETQVTRDKVSIRLTDPTGIKLDLPVMVNGRRLRVNFINTGVPHTVIFSAGLDKINVPEIGRLIRYHKQFAPRGTNVNFIEVLGKGAIKIRTYERGVEDETLACGTGSVASALIYSLKSGVGNKIMVHTKGGEILAVYFKRGGSHFSEVWLEGRAQVVYKGVYYV
jgi:diaminopimelate epimerase